jgi:hypothetical protein
MEQTATDISENKARERQRCNTMITTEAPYIGKTNTGAEVTHRWRKTISAPRCMGTRLLEKVMKIHWFYHSRRRLPSPAVSGWRAGRKTQNERHAA